MNLDVTKHEFVVLTYFSGVVGILSIVCFILSIVAFVHPQQSGFTPTQIDNLNEISANVNVANKNLVAAGFQTSFFSGIGATIKSTNAIIGNGICDTLTTNDMKVTTLVAPIFEIDQLNTTSIQLNNSQNNALLTPANFSYANIINDKSTTIESGSIVLFDKSTNESTSITSDKIEFQLNSGKIKSLVTLRFIGLNLLQSTNTPVGTATLLLPSSGGLQFGSLVIPPSDLKIGSTFQLTLYGTFRNPTGSFARVTITVGNTQTKINNQPAQVIIGMFPSIVSTNANSSGSWIYTIRFSINDIQTSEANGQILLKTTNISDVIVLQTSANINMQAGLQFSIWATWSDPGCVLTLENVYIEQLF
jgi:hypothetical protein